MAVRRHKINLGLQELLARQADHDLVIDALRRQIAELESERDQARAGLKFMEQALRRQGCCDSESSKGSL
jgi:hypothetical protein